MLAASGTFGYGTEVPLLERAGARRHGLEGHLPAAAGGHASAAHRRDAVSGMLNAIGLQGPGVEALIRDYAPQWADWDFPVLVNINGESAAEYGELAARLDGVPGVAGFEINISCPNVEQGGLYFGNDPRAAAAVTEAVRKRTTPSGVGEAHSDGDRHRRHRTRCRGGGRRRAVRGQHVRRACRSTSTRTSRG